MNLDATRRRRSVWPVVVGFLLMFTGGCASTNLRGNNNEDTCAFFDSLYQHSGFDSPVTLSGKATVDANQYRVRGVINLEILPRGELFFEFRSTMLFGSQVEDFFCSIVQDTIRIVDRERGRVFEGVEAERFLRESLDMDFAVTETLDLALGGHPPCDQTDGLEVVPRSDGTVVTGRLSRGGFRVEFFPEHHKIKEILWPIPGDRAMSDRLRVEYDWVADGDATVLSKVTIHLEEREWRCRLVAATN